MNTSASPVRRLLTGSWLALSLVLAGCDYGHPYGEPSGVAIDPGLLGTWVEVGHQDGKEPGTLEVAAVTEAEFLVKYSGHTFHARRVKETQEHFLQLQLPAPTHGEPSSRSYVFCFFEFDGDELVVNRISEPKQEAEHPVTAEAVRAWVGRAVQGESYMAKVYRFRRR